MCLIATCVFIHYSGFFFASPGSAAVGTPVTASVSLPFSLSFPFPGPAVTVFVSVSISVSLTFSFPLPFPLSLLFPLAVPPLSFPLSLFFPFPPFTFKLQPLLLSFILLFLKFLQSKIQTGSAYATQDAGSPCNQFTAVHRSSGFQVLVS